MSWKDAISKTNIQGIIALIIIIGGLYILAFNRSSTDIKIAVVGLMGNVMGYYFGTSQGSAKKTELIGNRNENNG
jgi:hypothetical protein